MFEDLKKNILQEKRIIADMKSIALNLDSEVADKEFYVQNLHGLASQLDILNETVPELLKEWSGSVTTETQQVGEVKRPEMPVKTVKEKAVPKEMVRMSYLSPKDREKKFITIDKKDRAEFLKKLKLSDDSFKKIKDSEAKSGKSIVRKANFYASFSNRYFRKYSEKLSSQFNDLNNDLKKANINVLLASYLSMAMMSMLIAFVLGFLFFGFLLVLSLSNWIYFFIPVGAVGLVMTGFYLYPSSEAGSVDKGISYELPFATIHMSAIAGSNISPLKIFKILVRSGEYSNFSAEVQKVVTQVDIYGYDLVTALKDVAKRTSNKRLSELFSGLATNISSGGALKNYLDKKSENFLVDYRLERQKYSALAGTFMDVYISILIAAPLILMMLFIVMNVSGLSMGGLGIKTLMFLAVGGLIVTNVVFIVILNMKQPKV